MDFSITQEELAKAHELEPHYLAIAQYWTILETLLHTKIEGSKNDNANNKTFFVDAEHPYFPWEINHPFYTSLSKVDEKKEWSFMLYMGFGDVAQATDSLLTVFSPDSSTPYKSKRTVSARYRKRTDDDVYDTTNKYAIFSTKVFRSGIMNGESMVMSSFAWAHGKVREFLDPNRTKNHQNTSIVKMLSEFAIQKEMLLNEVVSDSTEYIYTKKAQFMDLKSLNFEVATTLFNKVLTSLNLASSQAESFFVVKAVLVDKNEEDSNEESGILNSFYLNDLTKLQKDALDHRLSIPLQQYLTKSIDIQKRVDVRRSQSAHAQWMMPKHYPQGCWPSPGHHPLVYSQQAIINTFLKGQQAQPGLFSVNGPPGTGKTTLLRDIVAAVVTERAQALMQFTNPLTAFEKPLFDSESDFETRIALPHESICGFEIVIASSNNGAVENVTLEIPSQKAVDPSVLSWMEPDYFTDVADLLLKKKLKPKEEPIKAWGLLATKLGNKANCTQFVKKFWLNYVYEKAASDEYEENGDEVKKTVKSLGVIIKEYEKDISKGKGGFEKFLRQHKEIAEKEIAFTPSLVNQIVDILPAAITGNAYAELTATYKAEWETAVKEFKQALDDENKIMSKKKRRFTAAPAKVASIQKENVQDTTPSNNSSAPVQVTKVKGSPRLLSSLFKSRAVTTMPTSEPVAPITFKEAPVINAEPTWVNVKDLELSSPWMDQEWYNARVNVFLKALQLQRVFVLANAEAFKTNMNGLMRHFAGDTSMSPEQLKACWQTLFLLIPVVSTTFASFSRLFETHGHNSIGYILIDEAGQANPQAPVSALDCGKHIMMIGDPQQIEPVITLEATLIRTIANYMEVPFRWQPGRVSALNLADRVNKIGTNMELSNQLAYNNMMIFGTSSHAKYDHLDKSKWIHVKSFGARSNWVPEEGVALEALLKDLQTKNVQMKDVFLISPFRDVIKNSAVIAKKYEVKSSTLHAVQGQENAIVILVMGSRADSPGTRKWATEKPNLFNVAVTRAKERLYVIGDRILWSEYTVSKTLIDMLDQHNVGAL